VDGVGVVEDGVDAYSLLEDEGGIVKRPEKGSYGEGVVGAWLARRLLNLSAWV
jgi:hypothetical protein